MKTVLQIIPSLKQINGGKRTLDIAKELAENNFKSVIISSGGEMAEKYKYKGVDHHKIEIESKGFLNFFNKILLLKILDDIQPDLIHIRSRWPAFCFQKKLEIEKYLLLRHIMVLIAEIIIFKKNIIKL